MGPTIRLHSPSGRVLRRPPLLTLLVAAAGLLGCDSKIPSTRMDAEGADAAPLDSGAEDAGRVDAGRVPDGSATDAPTPDAPLPDAVTPDGGPAPCEPIGGVTYGTLSREGPATDRPPAMHADLNLALRGWSETGGTLGLIDLTGPTDTLAPTLSTLLPDDRIPGFVRNYRVNQWDWATGMRGPPITDWEVTLTGFATTPGEVLEVPDSGYDIGGGNDVLVLFVSDDSITLKYTREDNVVSGYTVHAVGVCVEPSLRALYESSDRSGRVELPALRGQQPFGRARGSEVLISIRDTGQFMDPRSRKDWW